MIGSGMSAQLGWALEDVVGVFKAPTVFVPFVSESMTLDIERVDSDPVTEGRVLGAGDWVPGERTVGGDIGLELYTRGLTKLLWLAFGAVATQQVAVDRWAHTFTPGALTGRSATVQIGKPQSDGMVVPFTYTGCKVASWEIALVAGEIATIGVSFAALDETTLIPLVPASYPVGLRALTASRARLALDSTALDGVRSLRLAGDNALDVDRRPVADSTTVDEPLEDGRRSYTGSVGGEFRGWHYNRFLDGSVAALAATMVDPAGESVTVSANVRVDGTTPTVGGRDVLAMSAPFTCLATSDDATAVAVTVENNSPTP